MKRSDIIRTIQVQFKHMRASDAAAILDTISEYIVESVANGDRIEIRGFGTFQSRMRSAKMGYNPCSGESMPLPSGKTVLFKPSRELTKKMNG
ncbi:MAG: integration host factor subunit beta [Proteobacteria bacterium]|nr:integration host factor subunit beta [Candidatus Enterousia scatequi]